MRVYWFVVKSMGLLSYSLCLKLNGAKEPARLYSVCVYHIVYERQYDLRAIIQSQTQGKRPLAICDD